MRRVEALLVGPLLWGSAACSSAGADTASSSEASSTSTSSTSPATTTQALASSTFCSLAADAVRGQFDFTSEASVRNLVDDPSLTEEQAVLMKNAAADAVRQITAGNGYSNEAMVDAVNQICGLNLTPVTMIE